MTIDETALILGQITATYPALRINRATIEQWHRLLQDLDYDQVRAATETVLRTQEGAWWPAPGAIRREVVRRHTPPTPSADVAWGQVLRAIQRWGYMQPQAALAELDPVVRRVTQAFGWQALCEGQADVVRGQWIRLYQSAQDDGERRQVSLAAGTVEDTPERTAMAQWLRHFGRGEPYD